jgi:hypothetical protein
MLGIKRITGAAGPAPEGEPGSWVSDAAREKFMAAYGRAFALWPQPCEEFDVETATATTRVHAYRPHPGGAPIVLLTGAGFNASSWYPHVAALATDGPVYGLDMPGDPNPSVLGAQRADLADRADQGGLAHPESPRDQDLGCGGQHVRLGRVRVTVVHRARPSVDAHW